MKKLIVPVVYADKSVYLVYDWNADQSDQDTEFSVFADLYSATTWCDDNDYIWELSNE